MSELTGRLSTAIADRYRIERELGQGGMATVYLAHDVKHDRKVALKVLRPELAAVIGAERFLQEIKTTANLQHPHILALFDSGEADGFVFYVMPFVEGESLRDRITREHQLPVDEAVRIAREVADALEYAHGHGVVHRDIKPENVLLHGGHALVADFGIALAVSRSDGGTRMTETGMSLGTPHYMSPEQAMGEREITPKADVYALGCVLYEMLTGEPPFTGPTAQAIVARVMTDQPRSLTLQRHTIRPHVEAAVHRALEKLPADRFESAGAFAAALADTTFRTVAGAATSGNVAPGRRWRGARPLHLAGVGLVGVVVGVLLMLVLAPEPDMGVRRYGLALPVGQEHLDHTGLSFDVAPDGSWFVYEGPAPQGRQLWLKERNAFHAVPVPGTLHPGGSAPTISPDGEWIVFTVTGQLRKVPRGGGSGVTLADSVSAISPTVAWLDDQTIVYRDDANRLRRVPDVGGPAEIIWTPPPDDDLRPRLPTPLPNAEGVLFTVCTGGSCDNQTVWVLRFDSGESRALVPEASRGWYLATGHLVYIQPGGGVFAAPFDLGSLTLTGPAVPVFGDVKVDLGFNPDLAISRSGTVLMIAGSASSGGAVSAEAVWVQRDGVEVPVDPQWEVAFRTNNSGWAIAPDGRRLAVVLWGDNGDDVWIKELDRGPLSRVTTDPSSDVRPQWTPDGRAISFISFRTGGGSVYRRRADATEPAELVVTLDEPIFEAAWSRDGQQLLLRTGDDGGRDIWVFQVNEDTVPRRIIASEFDERAMSLSPDGRWLVYQSDETGRDEIYVRPFPDVRRGKWTISLGGGSRPRWARNGRELFYVHDPSEMLVVARFSATDRIEVISRQELFSVREYYLDTQYTPYDISIDDERFLMMRPRQDGESMLPTAMVLVENWFEELQRQVRR